MTTRPNVPTVTTWPLSERGYAVSIRRGDEATTVAYEATEVAAAHLAAYLRGALADAYLAGRADAEPQPPTMHRAYGIAAPAPVIAEMPTPDAIRSRLEK